MEELTEQLGTLLVKQSTLESQVEDWTHKKQIETVRRRMKKNLYLLVLKISSLDLPSFDRPRLKN